MSNIANLSSRIAKLSAQLTEANSRPKTPENQQLVEDLEDEIFQLEEELEDATDAERDGGYGWG